MIKYCMMAGHIVDKNGNYRYVSPKRLIHLYGLDPNECVTAPLVRRNFKLPDNLIPLFPKTNGNYTTP